MSEVMTCPHCLSQVPRGATVCTGCQAEVEYGPARMWYLGLLALAVAGGSEMSFLVGAVVAIGGFITLNWVFSERVAFKRIYRT